jgi:beta-N-acetylglucosaminidase
MEILNHYINTVKARTFYTIQMGIYAYANNDYRRGGQFISTIEHKTVDAALNDGLVWLGHCDDERSQADFRVLKVRVYPDGSVRFWQENHWHASIKYLEFVDYNEEMIVRALTLREEALKGLAA